MKGSPETFFSIYFIIIFTVNISNCTTNLQHFMGTNMSLEVARIPDFSYQFTISLDCKINIEIYERINLCFSFFFSALSNNWCIGGFREGGVRGPRPPLLSGIFLNVNNVCRMPPHPPRLSRLWREVALSLQLLRPPVSEFPGSAPVVYFSKREQVDSNTATFLFFK